MSREPHKFTPADEALAVGWQADDERNRALYRRLVAEHGLSHRSLNWGTAAGQLTRFEVLGAIGVEADASVLDVGCGTGDLCVFLRERGFRGRYIGIDITPEILATAKGRGLDAEFRLVDLLAADAPTLEGLVSDYVFASGIFYFRQQAPQQFLEAMARRLLDLARIGAAFNSLSTWADQPAAAGEFRADPAATLAYCRALTPWVSLRHDYHPADFTIHMRRRSFGGSLATEAGPAAGARAAP